LTITIAFETHSLSEDNERGIASGWNQSRLSGRGRALAAELGDRRRDDGIDAVFASDLRRAVETVEIAFASSAVPVFLDWRLRECNYGERNGAPAAEHGATRAQFIARPYPGGESWRSATARVDGAIDDICGCDRSRVLVVGHVATRWALERRVTGRPLEQLAKEDFAWREGWEYSIVA
jgi:2,3-bisphosphoglycerate-dependent phosphoglycerate mutase